MSAYRFIKVVIVGAIIADMAAIKAAFTVKELSIIKILSFQFMEEFYHNLKNISNYKTLSYLFQTEPEEEVRKVLEIKIIMTIVIWILGFVAVQIMKKIEPDNKIYPVWVLFIELMYTIVTIVTIYYGL